MILAPRRGRDCEIIIPTPRRVHDWEIIIPAPCRGRDCMRESYPAPRYLSRILQICLYYYSGATTNIPATTAGPRLGASPIESVHLCPVSSSTQLLSPIWIRGTVSVRIHVGIRELNLKILTSTVSHCTSCHVTSKGYERRERQRSQSPTNRTRRRLRRPNRFPTDLETVRDRIEKRKN